jgi:hypothetical protein
MEDLEFVALGFHEHLDVIEAINFLNVQFQISDFVLWGRSMGSACAVMAASMSPHSGDHRRFAIRFDFVTVFGTFPAGPTALSHPADRSLVDQAGGSEKGEFRLR